MAKFGDEDGAFSLRCAELALAHWPTSIQAMLLKSGSLHKAWQQAADGEKEGIEEELTAVCAAIAATGYEPVPQALYWEWLTSSGEEKYDLGAPVQHAKNRAAPGWYTGKVLTLTDGRYEEYHVQPDTLRVGGLLFDVPNGKIVAFDLPEEETLVDAQAVGKFLSVDPLAASYPWYTPYQFAGNMPIQAVDLDGLEPDLSNIPDSHFTTYLQITDYLQVKSEIFAYIYMQVMDKEQALASRRSFSVFISERSRNGKKVKTAGFMMYEDEEWLFEDDNGVDYDYNIFLHPKEAFRNDRLTAVAIAEETFHAAQVALIVGDERYLNRKSPIAGNLADEVEVRVYRAYADLLLIDYKDHMGRTWREPAAEGLKKFVNSTSVQNYFQALRDDDKEAIATHEPGFRKDVIELARSLGESEAYRHLRMQFGKFQDEGGKTPLFDKLTKQYKLND